VLIGLTVGVCFGVGVGFTFGLLICAEVAMPKFSPKHKIARAKKPVIFNLFLFIANDFTRNDTFLKDAVKKWH
jgi:hypothetical protein